MRNLFFKVLNKTGIHSISRFFKNDNITVLSLHRVSEEIDFFFKPIPPKNFVEILEYCTKYYSVISFSDINKPTSKPKLILSFDDGYYDFYEIAIPILKRYGLPCNHNFVNECLSGRNLIWTQKLNCVFDHLKKNNIFSDKIIEELGIVFKNNWWAYYLNFFHLLLKIDLLKRLKIIDSLMEKYDIICNVRMINWAELKHISRDYDVDIGSHTYIHDSMISIKDPSLFEYHIGQSISEFNQYLGIKVDILSLPNGQFNSKVIEYSKSIGIKYLLHVDNSLNHENIISSDFNQISRIPIFSDSVNETISRIELTHKYLSKIHG